MSDEKKIYMNEKQVASELGVSIQTLRNHRRLKKGLPFRRFGRRILYKWSEVTDYLDKGRVDFS